MKRIVLAGLTALVIAPLAALPATAGPPRHYHTISATHGFAVVTEQLDECLVGEVFVSSSIGKYASQPGPVNKQGLTGVFVRISDTCGEPEVGVKAGGGGGAAVLEADGQNMAPLVVDSRLRAASVHTTIAAQDGDGQPVTIHLDATWTGIGELEHTTAVTHENYRGEGVVNSTANDLRRVAEAEVSVVVDGWSVSGFDPGQNAGGNAVLEQSKSRCIEVPRPGVEGFYPCFGFPG